MELRRHNLGTRCIAHAVTVHVTHHMLLVICKQSWLQGRSASKESFVSTDDGSRSIRQTRREELRVLHDEAAGGDRSEQQAGRRGRQHGLEQVYQSKASGDSARSQLVLRPVPRQEWYIRWRHIPTSWEQASLAAKLVSCPQVCILVHLA